MTMLAGYEAGSRRGASLIHLIGGASLALSSWSASLAQSAENTASTLEEVVVTAERRSTDLQRTALSIVALDSTALEEKGVTDLGDLAQATPGLSTVTDIAGVKPTFAIRGVGNSSGRETQESGVALYVDDIYMPRANGAYLQLVDVDRVEVLRGPQGTLFGRNSSGGAIRYLTRKPTHDFEARATASLGSDDLLNFTALVNIPLGDAVAARFQAGSFKQDGYVDFTQAEGKAGNTDDVVGRGVFRWFAGEDVTVDVGMTYARSQRDRAPVVVLANNANDFQTRALNARLIALGQAPLTNNDPRFVLDKEYAANGTCYIDNNTLAPSANGVNIFGDVLNYCRDGSEQTTKVGFFDINWKLSDAVAVRALSGYIDGKTESFADGGGLGTVRFADSADYDSFSQELQLSYSADRFSIVGGLYYFEESPVRTQYNAQLATTPARLGQCCEASKTDTEAATESLGAFTQASIFFTPDLQLTLGARYSRDEKELSVRRSDRPTAAPGSLFTNEGDWSDADYRGTLQYQINPDLMAYATVATGFKSGGFNDSPTVGAVAGGGIYAYNPEQVINYELGFKSQWFADRLRLNLTGFRMDYTDLQLTAPFLDASTTPPTTVLVTQNAGKIRLSGIEAEVVWRATDALTLNGSVSTLDQKTLSLSNSNGLLITSTCSNPAAPTFSTCESQDIAAAPEYQFTAGALYSLLLQNSSVNLGANYAYTAEKYSQNNATSGILLPSYGLLNLRAEYVPTNAHWSVSVFANNVTDEYYLVAGQNGAGFFGATTGVPGRPATYGMELKVHF